MYNGQYFGIARVADAARFDCTVKTVLITSEQELPVSNDRPDSLPSKASWKLTLFLEPPSNNYRSLNNDPLFLEPPSYNVILSLHTSHCDHMLCCHLVNAINAAALQYQYEVSLRVITLTGGKTINKVIFYKPKGSSSKRLIDEFVSVKLDVVEMLVFMFLFSMFCLFLQLFGYFLLNYFNGHVFVKIVSLFIFYSKLFLFKTILRSF